MPNMNLHDTWKNEPSLIEYLGGQLLDGRIGLFLGAGVSRDYGLPDWKMLLTDLCVKHGEPPPAKGDNLVTLGGHLRAKYYKNKISPFLIDVKTSLYGSTRVDFARLRRIDTLAAIGALAMSSKRGSVGKIFTLNYDDLLENYLEFHGFTTTSVVRGNHWASDEDMVIYHPHGLIPLADRVASDDIILGTADYFKIMLEPEWRPIIDTALRAHTFLYLGLSGEDMHLQSLVAGLKGRHAITGQRILYHGIRFDVIGGDERLASVFEDLGVFTHILTDWDKLPEFLFRVCQAARGLRQSK
jgi:hypothetical protein